MKIKKILSLALVASLCMSTLLGCGSKQNDNSGDDKSTTETLENSKTEGTAESETPTEEKISGKITLSAWDVDTQLPYIRPMVQEFVKQNPDIEVEIIDIPSADYTNKLSIDLNGGTASDLIMIKDADTTYSFNKKGQLADLTSYMTKDNVDLSIYNGLAENFNFDGKQAGLPVRTDYYMLFYNKDIFDAAGVEYPSNDMTWDEFEETAAKLTSGEGQEKIYGAHFHTWQALIQNWSVQDGKNTIMGPDYSFMKPYYEMALRMQNDGIVQDYATLKTGNIHYSGVFQNGQVAMMPMGSWYMSTHIDAISKGETEVKNWGVATIPHSKDIEAGNTVGSTTPMAINNSSKNQEAAWELLKFFTSYEGAKMLAEYGQFPGCVNEELLSTITSIEGMPEGAKEALKVKGIVLDRPIVQYVNEVNKMLEEVHGLIMLEESSIDDGLSEISTRSEEIQAQ